jgi:uncharacterized iron-regulated membrane protein
MPYTDSAPPTAGRLRVTSKWLHTWTGLIFGALVSLICLTGSLIVFRHEVERSHRAKDGATGRPTHNVSFDAAAREISRLQPGARVTRVTFPSNPDDPYVFRIRSADNQTRSVIIDASSGQVRGELQKVAWLEWMIDLHRNVLAAKPGRGVVGGIGIVAFALSATGLLLWLLSGGNWRALVTIRTKPSRRFNFELHRAAGLWAMCFMVVISLTGVGLAYPQTLRGAWEHLTGQPAAVLAPKLAEARTQQQKSLDEYIAIGRAAIPDGAPTELRVPVPPTGPVIVRIWRSGDLTQTGSNRVYIDPESGRVLSTDLAANWPLGVRLFQALAPIHYGEFGGLPIKILWSLLGVAPAVLFVTGFLFWWRPGKQKRGSKIRPELQEREDQVAELAGR